MAFKVDYEYEVLNGYKLWTTSQDTEVADEVDGEPFEVIVEGAIALQCAILASAIGIYFF